jgi:hypothetical protein
MLHIPSAQVKRDSPRHKATLIKELCGIGPLEEEAYDLKLLLRVLVEPSACLLTKPPCMDVVH